MLPEHLRHHAAGADPLGAARNTGGLLVRGVVIAVQFPADYTLGDLDPSQIPCVTCDVLVYEERRKTILYGVPVLVQSGGYDNHEVWVPRAASSSVSGGTYTPPEQRGGTAANDTDGDHVVVGFLNNDPARPIILGQLAHPKTQQRPTDTTVRWSRVLEGTTLRVDTDGTVRVSPATKVVINDGAGTDPEQVILGRTFLTDLAAGLTEVVSALTGLGLPAANLAQLVSQINTALSSDAPYLATNLETD